MTKPTVSTILAAASISAAVVVAAFIPPGPTAATTECSARLADGGVIVSMVPTNDAATACADFAIRGGK
jgi:hypothetical protein